MNAFKGDYELLMDKIKIINNKLMIMAPTDNEIKLDNKAFDQKETIKSTIDHMTMNQEPVGNRSIDQGLPDFKVNTVENSYEIMDTKVYPDPGKEES